VQCFVGHYLFCCLFFFFLLFFLDVQLLITAWYLQSLLFVDIKGVNGRRTQYNGNKEKVQNDKQRSIKLYIEINIEHHETHWVPRRAQVPWKGSQYIDGNKTIRYFYFTL
jgi:hypothetical protein